MTSPSGIETSMTEFSGREYTLPSGMRDCAVRLPLRICRKTGIRGGMNGAQLMRNSVHSMAAGQPYCIGARGVTYEGEV